jgi:hypothetical protein
LWFEGGKRSSALRRVVEGLEVSFVDLRRFGFESGGSVVMAEGEGVFFDSLAPRRRKWSAAISSAN